jgi:hypothetical protein
MQTIQPCIFRRRGVTTRSPAHAETDAPPLGLVLKFDHESSANSRVYLAHFRRHRCRIGLLQTPDTGYTNRVNRKFSQGWNKCHLTVQEAQLLLGWPIMAPNQSSCTSRSSNEIRRSIASMDPCLIGETPHMIFTFVTLT